MLDRPIQLLVRDVEGRIKTVSARGRTSIAVVQQRLSAKTSIPASQLRLSFAGRELHPRSRLSDVKIRGGSTLHLSLRLLGGGLPASFRKWLETNFKSAFTEVSGRIGTIRCLARSSKSAGASISTCSALIRQCSSLCAESQNSWLTAQDENLVFRHKHQRAAVRPRRRRRR